MDKSNNELSDQLSRKVLGLIKTSNIHFVHIMIDMVLSQPVDQWQINVKLKHVTY